MGHDPDRKPPFFFAKPANAVVPGGGELPFSDQTDGLHHEIDLVAAFGRGGTNVGAAEALELVYGYAVGLGMNLCDVQAEAEKLGRPWDLSKPFDWSYPIVPAARIGHPDAGRIAVVVSGEVRQSGDLN